MKHWKSLFLIALWSLFLLPFGYSMSDVEIPHRIERDILKLSEQKWQWMQKREIDSLRLLLDENFIGRVSTLTFDKAEQLDVISNTNQNFEDKRIVNSQLKRMGDAFILMTTVTVVSLQSEQEPLSHQVTEIYTYQDGQWKLHLLEIHPTT